MHNKRIRVECISKDQVAFAFYPDYFIGVDLTEAKNFLRRISPYVEDLRVWKQEKNIQNCLDFSKYYSTETIDVICGIFEALNCFKTSQNCPSIECLKTFLMHASIGLIETYHFITTLSGIVDIINVYIENFSKIDN